jgi:leucyl-tRNA synthetase
VTTASAPVRPQVDLAAIETKWHKRWAEAHAYERNVEPGRAKFLATYPYSYMNAFAHVGHAFTMMRVDLMVRYQRMKGANALFPFGYHVTGTPIVNAASAAARAFSRLWAPRMRMSASGSTASPRTARTPPSTVVSRCMASG